MRFDIGLSLVSLLVTAPLLAQTYPHEVRPLGRGAPRLPAAVAPPAADGALFQQVDALGHQDDFWLNSLVGDADHDGRQEIVLREVPTSPGGTHRIVFHEDNGAGQFGEAYSFVLADGGLLAIGDVDKDGLTDLFLERALGFCDHEFVWRESSSPGGFPDHEVWTAKKEGNVTDFRAVIADVDSDGRRELVVADDNFSCLPTSLKLFEAGGPQDPPNALKLVVNLLTGGDLGNPVVADFDQDGKQEIAVAEAGSSSILVFESAGSDAVQLVAQVPHALFNSYQLALIGRTSPDGRPMLFLAGQMGSADYRVQVYEALAGNSLALVNQVQVPASCGASIPQIWAADVQGTRVPEIILDRLCDPVPVYEVKAGGAMTLFDMPVISESLEIVATTRTPSTSGALVVGCFPSASNPSGATLVLELP